ncbi:unnamed protein product [Cladocopium goreaui]|uniref:Uncharacterized protein n=1 Tax=Cladocopium goreaui TaxID=2562237 RepID=A0A9P1GKS7_9DINO|nr:unnamed protein product [Cladocopium goreaui]
MAWSAQFTDQLCWRLKALGAPKVLLFAVLLTTWTVFDSKSWQDETRFRFVEMFAGQAEVTRMFRYASMPAARLDLNYMEAQPDRMNPMDLLSDAGMVTALAVMLRGDSLEGWRDFLRMLSNHGGPHCVHKTTWYMLHYGGASPKPLFGFSNSKHVGKLNQGRLQGWATKKKSLKEKGTHKDLVIKYVDSNGRKRWKGSPDLRSSESYPPKFGLKLVELFHDLINDKSGMPELPSSPLPSSEETFRSMDFDDVWTEASMVSVCHYLRAGCHLRIPEKFRDLLPKKL